MLATPPSSSYRLVIKNFFSRFYCCPIPAPIIFISFQWLCRQPDILAFSSASDNLSIYFDKWCFLHITSLWTLDGLVRWKIQYTLYITFLCAQYLLQYIRFGSECFEYENGKRFYFRIRIKMPYGWAWRGIVCTPNVKLHPIWLLIIRVAESGRHFSLLQNPISYMSQSQLLFCSSCPPFKVVLIPKHLANMDRSKNKTKKPNRVKFNYICSNIREHKKRTCVLFIWIKKKTTQIQFHYIPFIYSIIITVQQSLNSSTIQI